MDLNLRAKTITFIGVHLWDHRLSYGFLDMTPKAEEIKEKLD